MKEFFLIFIEFFAYFYLELETTNSFDRLNATPTSSLSTSCQGHNHNQSLSFTSNTESDELESDDYRDLMMMKNDKNVKFAQQQEIQKQTSTSETTGDNLEFELMNETAAISDTVRRFTKSPHPRGSARFAVRPLANNQEFIDSLLPDSSRSLHEAIEVISKQLNENKQQNLSLISTPLLSDHHQVNKIVSPPELPPRASSSSSIGSLIQQQNVLIDDEEGITVPQPKPRISKLISNSNSNKQETVQTIEKTANNNNLSTNPLNKQTSINNSTNQAATSSILSHQQINLPPIPVPEKSAAISQTIQHFANLQRQNNLRRCSQLQQSQTNINTTQNSDYDYLSGGGRVVIPGTQHETSPGIGNPLYSSVPLPPLHQRIPPPVPLEFKHQSGSILDQEYARLYGDKKPTFGILPSKNESSESPQSSSSLSSSTSCSSDHLTSLDHQQCSLPPPKGSPPPLPSSCNALNAQSLPPVVGKFILKNQKNKKLLNVNNNTSSLEDLSHIDDLPDNNNNNMMINMTGSHDVHNDQNDDDNVDNIDFSSTSSFLVDSTKISSPKIITRQPGLMKQTKSVYQDCGELDTSDVVVTQSFNGECMVNNNNYSNNLFFSLSLSPLLLLQLL